VGGQQPFLDGVSQLTDDVTSVLPAADSLEQLLKDLVTSATEDEAVKHTFEQQMVAYQVISSIKKMDYQPNFYHIIPTQSS
jgi:hypothetical protein